MNDEKVATSMENQIDAGGSDPLPPSSENEDPALDADADVNPNDVADRSPNFDADDPIIPAPEPAASSSDDQPDENHLSVSDPLQAPHPDPAASPALVAQEQLGMLQRELTQLREELSAMQHSRENFRRMTDELREFHTLYPEVSLSQIPDEVYEGMYSGIPPAAGYALYLKREHEKQKEADRINKANCQRSSGSLFTADADYFSPAEVRAMSQSEVRKNYQKIMLSMQKWH